MRSCLLPVLILAAVLCHAAPALAGPPDVVWQTVLDKQVELEMTNGTELVGTLLGFDADNVVVVREDGRVVTLERDTVAKVSLQQGGGRAGGSVEESRGEPSRRDAAPARDDRARQGDGGHQDDSGYEDHDRARSRGDEPYLEDDMAYYREEFAQVPRGSAQRKFLHTLADTLRADANDYDDVDRQEALRIEKELRTYASLFKTDDAVGQVGNVFFWAGAAPGIGLMIAGIYGTALCGPSDLDACAVAPLLAPGIGLLSMGLGVKLGMVGLGVSLGRKAVSIRKGLGFAANMVPILDVTPAARLASSSSRPQMRGALATVSFSF